MVRKKKPADFEEAVQQLEGLVETLEKGDLPLDAALKAFEEGVQLTSHCQKILTEAEQKVQLLTEQNGELTSTSFEPTEPV
ncbi:MAG: exodeoxyribonuclease VII small subunit [Pontibacterium sp.]